MDAKKAYEWHKSMLEMDNGEVEDVLEAAQFYIEELERENGSFENDKDEMTGAVAKLEDEKAELTEELAKLRKELEGAKPKKKSTSKMTKAELEEENKRLKMELELIESMF